MNMYRNKFLAFILSFSMLSSALWIPVYAENAEGTQGTSASMQLLHTADSAWTTAAGESFGLDAAKQYFNNDTNSGWAACGYIQFDISELAADAKITSAALSFDATSTRDYPSELYYLTANNTDLTALTNSSSDRFTSQRQLITEFAGVQGGKTVTEDVKDAVKARLGKDEITFMLTANAGSATFTGKGADSGMPTLTVTVTDSAVYKITVNCVDETGAIIKTAQYDAVEGEVFTPPYDADFNMNGKKYTYFSGADSIESVSGNETINLVYSSRALTETTVTVTTVINETLKTLAEAKVLEGSSVTVGYPKYIVDGSDLYKTEQGDSTGYYSKTITGTQTDQSVYIPYSYRRPDAVFFAEAEDIGTDSNIANALIRCSGGKAYRATKEGVSVTTLQAGTYQIEAAAWGTAGDTYTISAGDSTVFSIETTGSLNTQTGSRFTLTEDTELKLTGTELRHSGLDYILITGTAAEDEPGETPVPTTTPSEEAVYTVTYNANGGTFVIDHTFTDTVTVTYTHPADSGVWITIPENVPLYEGYTFGGWYSYDTEAGDSADYYTDDGAVRYDSGGSAYIAKDAVFYAIWEKEEPAPTYVPGYTPEPTTPPSEEAVYTVTYDAAGGTFVIDDTFITYTHPAYSGVWITIPENVPLYEGYTFGGWYSYDTEAGDNADYYTDDGAVRYNPGDSAYITKDAVFYAIWEKEEPTPTATPTPDPTEPPAATPTPTPTAAPTIDPASIYYSEDFSGKSINGWTTSVDTRFDPVILEENGNSYLSVDQRARNNNGAVVTRSSLGVKADDYTMTFRMKLGNSNNQTPVTFTVYDSSDSTYLLKLTAAGVNTATWTVNEDASETITLPSSGVNEIANIRWCDYKITKSDGTTYLSITDANGNKILDKHIIETKAKAAGVGKLEFVTKRYNANFAIDDITVREVTEEDLPDIQMAKFDVVYVSDDNTPVEKTSSGVGEVGVSPILSNAQKAAFMENGQKYIYVSDDSGSVTITEDGSSVVTVTVRKAAVCEMKVTAVVDNSRYTLVSENVFEGDTFAYAIPKYLTDDSLRVIAQTDLPSYSYEKTAVQSDEIEYSYTAYDGIAYFIEHEKLSSERPLESANFSSGYSTMAIQDGAEAFKAEGGTYQITVAASCRNVRNNSPFAVYKNSVSEDNLLFSGDVIGVSYNYVQTDGTITSDEVTLADNDSVIIQGSEIETYIDYILAVRTDSANTPQPELTPTPQETPSPTPIAVTGIELNKTSATIKKGDTETLTAKILPENASNQSISWVSTNLDTAEVKDGVVTAKAAGTTAIIALTADGGYNASCLVTVYEDAAPVVTLTGIRVTPPSNTTINEGGSLNVTGLSVTALYSDGTEKEVTDYTLSAYDSSIVGEQTITVYYGDYTGEFNITVKAKQLIALLIAQRPDKRSYIQGEALDTAGLSVTGMYNNGTMGDITDYTVSGYDPNVTGTQTITVSAGGFTTSFTVTVAEAEKPSESVSAPVFNINGFTGGKSIELTTQTEGAQIYYTTNGTFPTDSSELYTEAIVLTETTQLKAIAIKDGMTDSKVTSAKIPVSQVGEITASHGSGTLEAGTVITLKTATSGSTIYYTTDGNTPTADSERYTGSIIITQTTSIKAVAVKDGYANSVVFGVTYTIPVVQKDNPILSIGSVTAAAGDTVSLPVYVFTDETVSRAYFTVEYDKDAFEYVSITASEADPSKLFVSAVDGAVSVIYSGNALESGELCSVNFKAIDSASDGEYDVSLTADGFDTINGSVTLERSRNSNLDKINAEAMLTDSEGNSITDVMDLIDKGNDVTANVVVDEIEYADPEQTTLGANVILAVFDRSGGLISLNSEEVDLSDINYMFSCNVNIPDGVEVGSIKMMIWNNLSDMSPLMAASSIL